MFDRTIPTLPTAGAGRVGSTIPVVKLTMSAAVPRPVKQAQVASHEDVSALPPLRERFLLVTATGDLCRRLRARMSFLPTAIVQAASVGDDRPARVLGIRRPRVDLGGRALTAMSIWHQPDSGGVWTALATHFDHTNRWLCALIYHFSNYAIAY